MERRTFIKNSSLTVLSISAFGSLSWNGEKFEGDTPTTTDILGPFYRPGAPLRTNLRLADSNGTPIVLKGIIFKEDGKTPVNDAMVEIWHCDEHQVYDNASDEYNYRGGQITKSDGKYGFKSILPVPYKANPTDESSWRPAHIHMRVSVPNQQDLITQLYFKGGKYVETDQWASAPQAVNRILDLTEDSIGELLIVFNVTMSKEIPLDTAVYKKITGLYQMEDNTKVEFIKNDDLLFMKRNGQLVASLKYMGNNNFEGGIGFPKVSFELLADGGSKAVITQPTKTDTGVKFLKYNE
ncbi:catechol 1,2-dioxygenase [Aquiflexum sp.]|uniref:dioxygenase family protein n=1 Tax=Aquiflexum sp. TaxID=1872584 RepID=UPI003593D023